MPARYAFALPGAITRESTPCGFELWIRKKRKNATGGIEANRGASALFRVATLEEGGLVGNATRLALTSQLFGTFNTQGEWQS